MIRKCNRETITDTTADDEYEVLKETAAFKVGNLALNCTLALKDPSANTEKVFNQIAQKMVQFVRDNEDPHQLRLFVPDPTPNPNQTTLEVSVGKGKGK